MKQSILQIPALKKPYNKTIDCLKKLSKSIKLLIPAKVQYQENQEEESLREGPLELGATIQSLDLLKLVITKPSRPISKKLKIDIEVHKKIQRRSIRGLKST